MRRSGGRSLDGRDRTAWVRKMISEKMNLWFCDNFVAQPWQFFLLIVPLVGAFLYGRGKQKVGWYVIGAWVVVQVTLSALTNFVFSCTL